MAGFQDFRVAGRFSCDRAFSDYPRRFGQNREKLANRVTSIQILFIYRNKRARLGLMDTFA